ncbi:hypothetical protein V500_07980 [Pseudogymnoascus sp. VKM F-4518 (FW-2643)]|nr:hypothetical protein V500_07980 [Pseudogymnoascus sp. VKM F-4518 (FW-2643)]
MSAKTKSDALYSVISPQKALPDHLDKPNAVEAVDVKFDKEKIFAEMMSTEEVFNMDEETRKKTYILPSMPCLTPAGPEAAFKFLRELYNEMDEANEKSDDKFDEEKTIARVGRIMDEVFNMDDETRKKTSMLPTMPRPTPAGPEVAFKFLRELYAEMDEEDEALNNDSDAKNVPPAGGNDHPSREVELDKANDKPGNEFDREEIIASMRKTMDEVFNMDEETRKKTSPLPSMPRPKPVGPEVAFKFLRELYAEMDDENEAEEAARTRGQAIPNSTERE